ncbi:hypothetical protein [Fulvimarina sp. MAC3]|uniref:hypothetical protein n=1 Tax=Fulvimarina sp. MAC3 TaxID=3148887 RepID=UPI0031FCDBCF
MTTRLAALTIALSLTAGSLTVGTALAQTASDAIVSAAPDLKALVDTPVLQPGDESGAAELRTSLEPYVTKQAFENGVISIEPTDEGYRLDFALQALIDSIPAAKDMSITISDYSVLVSEQPDGRWYVSASGPLAFGYKLDTPPGAPHNDAVPQSVEYDTETMDWTGYFDPSIATYSNWEGYFGKTRQVQRSTDGTVTAVTEPIRVQFSGRPATDGTVDMEVIQFGGGARQEMNVPLDPANPQSILPIVISNGAAESVTIGKEVKTKELLRLYAVGLQLIQDPERKGLLEELKSALQMALPLWTDLASETKVSGFNVDLGSFGSGQVGSLDFDMDLDGISEAGDYTMAYDLSDMSVSSPFVPEWANALIPTRVLIRFDAENVDLWRPAAVLISDLRLDPKAPISEEAKGKIIELFKTSQAKLGLKNSAVTGRNYHIDYSAEFEDGDVAVQVQAEGIDAVIASLQEASQQYPEALQGVSFLQIAKGFGRPAGDDALEWNVDIASDGSVTVNGAMLKGPDPTPLPGSGNQPLDLDAPPPTSQPSDPL